MACQPAPFQKTPDKEESDVKERCPGTLQTTSWQALPSVVMPASWEAVFPQLLSLELLCQHQTFHQSVAGQSERPQSAESSLKSWPPFLTNTFSGNLAIPGGRPWGLQSICEVFRCQSKNHLLPCDVTILRFVGRTHHFAKFSISLALHQAGAWRQDVRDCMKSQQASMVATGCGMLYESLNLE